MENRNDWSEMNIKKSIMYDIKNSNKLNNKEKIKCLLAISLLNNPYL